jgi:hypothetical protein
MASSAPIAATVMGSVMNMTSNITTKNVASFLAERLSISTAGYTTVICVLTVLFLVNMLSTPRLEPGEPPLLKSNIPFIGHFIGIIRHQGKYLKMLSYVAS